MTTDFEVSAPRATTRRLQSVMVFAVLLLLAPWRADVAGSPPPPVWVGFQVEADIAYLLRKSPAVIMRYDLAAQAWMPALPLDEIPTAFVVGESHIYVSSGPRIERLLLDGNGETLVATTPEDVVELFLDGNVLFAKSSGKLAARVSSFDTATNALVDTHEGSMHSLSGGAIAPGVNRIHGRTIGYVRYDDAGNFLAQTQNPLVGEYPAGTRVWIWPDESKIADTSGTVYLAGGLTYGNSLATVVVDLAFQDSDVTVALTATHLVSYSAALVETGRVALSKPARNVTVSNATAFAFFEDATLPTEVGVAVVPLASLLPVQPGIPVSPIGLDYDITASAIDDDGVLYLLSKVNRSIFRWDGVEQKYLDTIALTDAADLMVYSAALDRLYLYGASRVLYRIDLTDLQPTPRPHVNIPVPARKLIPMGSDLLVGAGGFFGGAWVYDNAGDFLGIPPTALLEFHFYDEVDALLFVNTRHLGYLGQGLFSPLSNGPSISGYAPLRLSPDGLWVADRAGVIYQANPLLAIDALPNRIADVQWNAAGTMFTDKEVPNYPVGNPRGPTWLQRWMPDAQLDQQVAIPGRPSGLHTIDTGLVQATMLDGRPSFTVLDFDLRVVPPDVLDMPVLSIGAFSAYSISVSWNDVQGETGYEIERRRAGEGMWNLVGDLPLGSSEFVDTGHFAGSAWQYRVRAVNDVQSSEWSNIADADLASVVAPPPKDPALLQFLPDDAVLGRDGRIYLLSRAHQSLFVWNSFSQRWDRTIALRGPATHLSYSSSDDVLHTSYADGSIYSIVANDPFGAEVPFTRMASPPCGLVATDIVLAACDVIGSQESTHTYDDYGNLVQYAGNRPPIGKGAWSSARQRIYHFRDGTSPNDLLYTPINPDGTFGVDRDSPYHDSTGITYPIRVSPDGQYVVLGSGNVYEALNLQRIDTLAFPITDATWFEGALHTLGQSAINSHAAGTLDATLEVPLAQPGLRLFSPGQGLLVLLSNASGNLRVMTYGPDFEILAAPFSNGFE